MNIETLSHYSLSSPQKGIWFDQSRHADTPLYNVGGYVRIEGSVNACLLEKAIHRVIQENDALRTIFYEESPLPVQTFPKKSNFSLEIHDFSEENLPHQQALQWMENEFVTPFELYGQPLFKFALIKVSKDGYYGFCKYHHLIIDGWGISLVFQRIAKQYDALTSAGGIDEPTQYSYADFIQADQNYLQSENYQQHEQYWQKKYHQLPDPLIAPRMKVNGTPIPSHRQSLTLKWALYSRLIAFAKANKVSTFHLMIGVLYCYFMRTAETQEFVIGLPVLNRNSAAFKRTVGLFTGITPARFSFGTALNFIELMQAISQTLRKDYRHQRFPLGEINKKTGLQKQARKQLFDISLSYQKHDYLNTFAGHPAKIFTLPNGFEQSALAIAIEEYLDNQDVRVTFDYNLAMFDDAEIERLIARFESLLSEVLARPEVPIQTLNLMPESERQQVLVEFNQTAASYPADKTIVDLFEQQVESTPDKIAVVFEKEQLTYQALNSRANQLAAHLQSLGVGPEVLVGLCVKRSLNMLVGLLGILKAGGAYVPLDPSYPKERIALVLEDAQVSVFLTQEALIENLPEHQAHTLCLDQDWAKISAHPSHNPKREVKADNLAYVIYTSGSTGKPKGVSLCHRSVVNFLTTMQQSPGLTAQDILLAVTTIYFDIAVLELYLPLIVGAKVVLASRETASDGAQLLKALENSGATVMQATPATWRMLTTETDSRFPNIKMWVGGEALCRQLAEALLEKGGEIWNLYGPTETTVWSTIYPITRQDILTDLSSDTQESIGRPIANTEIYILDDNRQPLPIGIAGELHIGGAGLARGYFNRPELTQEKFISNPFSSDPGSRLYKKNRRFSPLSPRWQY
jgi:amino acid adenylation domain-containing protein